MDLPVSIKSSLVQEDSNAVTFVELDPVNDSAAGEVGDASARPTKPVDTQQMQQIRFHFKCELCGNEFGNKRPYHKHLDWHAGNPYRCEQCNDVFFSKFVLMKHCKEHMDSRYQCPECIKSYDRKSSLYNHCKTHHTALYSCTYPGCGYKVKSECRYKEHFKNFHRKQKTIPCTWCGRLFQTPSHLYTHCKSCF